MNREFLFELGDFVTLKADTIRLSKLLITGRAFVETPNGYEETYFVTGSANGQASRQLVQVFEIEKTEEPK